MPSQGQPQWDITRFISTLNFFGEVPFLGSFRWMQQLLGQSPHVPGIALSVMKKRVTAIGSCSPDLINALRKKLPASVDLCADEAIKSGDLYQQPDTRFSELTRLIRSVDSLIVIQPSELSRLLENTAISANNSSNITDNAVEYCVFDFSNPNCDLAAWGALDDVVMGGVSQGSFFLRDQQAVFAGNVSTDNSGGFSSVRTKNSRFAEKYRRMINSSIPVQNCILAKRWPN